jgi:hypothetical protein
MLRSTGSLLITKVIKAPISMVLNSRLSAGCEGLITWLMVKKSMLIKKYIPVFLRLYGMG